MKEPTLLSENMGIQRGVRFYAEYLLRASRPQWTKIFGLILMKTKIFFGDMSPQTVETWSP